MISQRWPDNFREVMKYEFGISIHGPTDPWQAANRWEAHFSSPARAVWTRARGFGLQRNYYTAWKQREVATVSRRCPLGNKDGILRIADEIETERAANRVNLSLAVMLSKSSKFQHWKMNPIPTERSIFFFWEKIAKMIARRAGNNKVRNEIRDSIKVESVANSSLTAKE